ncbi:MAG: DUF4091 domain-containing protein [Verrucomicrobiaceae bacterium]|nr:DUF4091 domain-containing protein [Verrucomicrobiaceae bacterium]
MLRLFSALLLCSSLHAADLVTEGWQHRVWTVYPVEKIKADEEVAAAPKLDAITISAARDEREPFVLLLRPDVPLREVGIVVSDLKQADGSLIAATQISSRRIGCVFIDEPSGTRIKQPMPYPTGTGLFPDPLLDNKGDVRPKHNLQFLVTVHVPRDARPGAYEGELRLKFRKESWMPATLPTEDVIKLRVNVRSFALPEHSPLLNTSYANLRELPESQRTPERVAAMQRDFIEHRQTPEPLIPSPRIKIDQGVLTVDSRAWEDAVEGLFASGGTHVMLPVWGFYPEPAFAQGLYFLYHYPAVTTQKWLGATICAKDRTLTPEFRQLFGTYLKHMHGVLKQRGWLDRAFIGTMDEPYTYHLSDRENDTPANNYDVVRNFVAFVREVAPGLRTFCTADPVEGLIGSIDHWCLRNLDHAAAAKERAEKHGEIVTFCDNYRTFIDYPAISARSFGWLAWRIGARGWLTYETLGAYRTAWEAPLLVYPMFSGATVWGMGQMFYPEPLTGAPLRSLRWELMREGCDDYEYLWLLREALKSKPNAEAQKLLDTAAQSIVAGGGDAETMAKARTANASSNQTAHQMREKIAGWIEKLAE